VGIAQGAVETFQMAMQKKVSAPRGGPVAQSAVDRPWNRTCRGCTCTRRQPNRRQVRAQALQAVHAQGRASTGRTRGRTIRQIVPARRQLRLGWRACCGVAARRAPRRALDPWIRRRRRRDPGKPWGRKRYRARRTRGVGRQLAWNTVTSAPGPWRLRPRPALAMALSQRYFATRGLPRLRAG
jgi:RNA-directed DNA polymerase